MSADRRRRRVALLRALPARRLAVLAVVACAFMVVAAAVGATGAAWVSRDAGTRAPAAGAGGGCATVKAHGPGLQPVTPHLIGAVSCPRARAVVGRYFTRVARGDCATHGNRCVIPLRAGWTCSFLVATESADRGGQTAGCSKLDHATRVRGIAAQIELFPAGRAPGRLHIDGFRSANLRVWCQINTDFDTFCVTGGDAPPGGPERGAFLDSAGQVTTCFVAHAGFAQSCTQNWGSDTQPLVGGQQTQAHGVRCTATNAGVRCVRVSGAGTGNGFFVSRAAARKITP